MILKNVILFLIVLVFNFKSIQSQIRNRKKPSLDDEDAIRSGNTNVIQSSGEGPIDPPDIYPTLDPYTKTRSTATILVDIAVEKDFKSYMLPGAPATSMLKEFYLDVIKNLKEELKSINVDLSFQIISLRPGPLIPKRISVNSQESGSASVFARINITQHNSSIVNPMIIFHISHCGRLGLLGNLSISDQIIFPQYVCLPNQVYCLPECRTGFYCDGKQDCPNTDLDESPSCPKCLYKNLKISSNSDSLNEGENLILNCEFTDGCKSERDQVRWTFPEQLKGYEKSFIGHKTVNSLPRNLIVSGSYRCLLDGDAAEKNISIFKKPNILITNADPDAEMVLITELEGSDIDLWCNTTDGQATWMTDHSIIGNIFQMDRKHSKISMKNLTATITIRCQVRWGFEERAQIVKTIKLNIVCDSKKQFTCMKQSSRICIPISQKCDSIVQCDDGIDEIDCNYCTEKALNVDVGPNIFKDLGDTLIMTCSASQETCYPLKWLRFGKPLVNTDYLLVHKQSVFILNISLEDAGVYRCSGPFDKGYTDVTLHVSEPPTLQINPPTSTINVTHGQSREIECLILESRNSNDVISKPMWSFNDKKIAKDNVKIKSEEDKISILSISEITKRNEGKYQCEVMWGHKSNKKLSAHVRINVLPLVCNDDEKMCSNRMSCISESMWCDGHKQCLDGSDEDMCNRCRNGFVFVQPSNLIILSKESATITCFYHQDCHPVEWRVAYNKVPLGSIKGLTIMENKLMLNNVRSDASNIYECFSGDKFSQVNVTVINEIEVTFLDSPPYVFVDYGSNIEINCKSNYGEPHWQRRDSKSMDEIVGAKQIYIQPNIARLTIKSASYDARGYYNCSVRMPGSQKEVAKKLMYIHVYELECKENQIKCDANTTCVSKRKICDNIQDCKDNSDEKNCSKCTYDLKIRPKSLVLSTAGWATLQCIVPHKDCLPIEWKTKTGEALSHKSFFKYNDSLFMFNPEPRINEEIICTNGKKSASAFITVKILELVIEPVLADRSVLYINKDDTKMISCKSNLGSPEWIFPKENILLKNGITVFKNQSNSVTLQFKNVQESANGEYICSVTFSKENKRKSISVTVI